MTKQADLHAYLFDGHPHLFSAELLAWMDASPRFTAFVETYRDKIRKKIRVTPEPESALDLRAELEIAYHLLNDRRLALTYEPYASEKRRGPDFGVTYRANLALNVEVARLRVEQDGAELPVAHKEERIQRILLDKLGQMQPSMPNLLVIHTHAALAHALDLSRLMQAIKTRAEGKDPAFYAASRYASPADFYKDFMRLSGIILWSPEVKQAWPNKQSRPTLEEKVLRVVAGGKD